MGEGVVASAPDQYGHWWARQRPRHVDGSSTGDSSGPTERPRGPATLVPSVVTPPPPPPHPHTHRRTVAENAVRRRANLTHETFYTYIRILLLHYRMSKKKYTCESRSSIRIWYSTLVLAWMLRNCAHKKITSKSRMLILGPASLDKKCSAHRTGAGVEMLLFSLKHTGQYFLFYFWCLSWGAISRYVNIWRFINLFYIFNFTQIHN